MKKSKLAKKAKHRKVVARKAAPRKVVRKVAKKRAVRKAAPLPKTGSIGSLTGAPVPSTAAPTDGAPPGSHLDAPAAGRHPGEGHESVNGSGVNS